MPQLLATTAITPVNADFAPLFQCLFAPKRFKVFYGGRGAGRSWGIARALLIMGVQRSIRVLCVRELQNSIEESVHKLLSDQIEALGLSGFYDIQKVRITGKNGTTFSFEGIKNNTTKIKSYEGIDYCWVEEAVKVSRASWGILIPTIRKETPKDWIERGMEKPDFAAEIWMTFNPELEGDYTFTRWVKDKKLRPSAMFPGVKESETSFVVKMTHADNPWFPGVLRTDMEAEKEDDYDNYLNVWEGHTLLQLKGAIYAKQLRATRESGRVCDVPWEREIPVDTYWDLGRADHTCIWFGQTVAMQFRVLDFLDGTGEDITFYLQALQRRGYVYGTMFLPHDAKHKKLVYKHSIEEIVRNSYPDTQVLPATSVADGINMSRLFFPKCWFDAERCADGLALLARYTYKKNDDGSFSNTPLHDDVGASDAADAFRYMAMGQGKGRASGATRVADRLRASLGLGSKKPKETEFSGRPIRGSNQGWMS